MLLLILFSCCFLAPDYVQMTSGVYTDGAGEVYFKVKNKGLAHPSKMDKYREYLLLREVFDEGEGLWRPLRVLVDPSSIERVHQEGTYFKDKNRMYIYPQLPISGPPFFAIEYRNAHFFGLNNDFVKIDDAVFSYGIRVLSLEPETTRYLQAHDQRTSTTVELLAGEKHLYDLHRPLSLDNFCLLHFGAELKEQLRNQYYPGSSC